MKNYEQYLRICIKTSSMLTKSTRAYMIQASSSKNEGLKAKVAARLEQEPEGIIFTNKELVQENLLWKLGLQGDNW